MDVPEDSPRRRRNIVLSYVRHGMSEGEAVRAADKLLLKLEARRCALATKRDAEHIATAIRQP